jgi:phosphopantothenoylcysteine decarboxylase/phosphopantothenate--cysteine ligase
MNLLGKNIVVAVCGGIAAYKSAELVRALQRVGAQVRVAMTDSATEFITAQTFQALSGYPVHLHDRGELDPAGMDHIALARWSDLIIVAPATANVLSKLSHGHADNFVTSLCLAHTGPLAVAPAMNQAMWNHSATQDNIKTLQQRSVLIFGPAEGLQACGETGSGRMLEPSQLVECCMSVFQHKDPVRYLSNRSSGKMGYALADAAVEAGADVHVISGPTHCEKNTRVNYQAIETAAEMLSTTMDLISDADIFIASAAVADYTPIHRATQKIKKHSDQLSIECEKTQDILKLVKQQYPDLFCVGFAAETENLVAHANSKLQQKSLNMIVANHVGVAGQGFDSDYNAAEIIWPQGHESVAKVRKPELARKIIQLISTLTQKNRDNVRQFQSQQN